MSTRKKDDDTGALILGLAALGGAAWFLWPKDASAADRKPDGKDPADGRGPSDSDFADLPGFEDQDLPRPRKPSGRYKSPDLTRHPPYLIFAEDGLVDDPEADAFALGMLQMLDVDPRVGYYIDPDCRFAIFGRGFFLGWPARQEAPNSSYQGPPPPTADGTRRTQGPRPGSFVDAYARSLETGSGIAQWAVQEFHNAPMNTAVYDPFQRLYQALDRECYQAEAEGFGPPLMEAVHNAYLANEFYSAMDDLQARGW